MPSRWRCKVPHGVTKKVFEPFCLLHVMSNVMQNSFAEGDIVEVPAEYFDDDDDLAAGKMPWSMKEFGASCATFII